MTTPSSSTNVSASKSSAASPLTSGKAGKSASPGHIQLHPIRAYDSSVPRRTGRRSRQQDHGFTAQGVQNREHRLIWHAGVGLHVNRLFTQAAQRSRFGDFDADIYFP